MNKNIDLGTFQWDTNKIEHQVAANTLEMNKFSSTVKAAREQIKEQSKEIALLESKIESENKAQARMTKELQAGTRSQESYNFEIQKSNQNLDQYVTEQIAAGKAQADNIIVINRAQSATKDLRLENNELNKLLGAGRTELSQSESAYRELNKELNALKIEAKNLGVQMLSLEKEGKQGTDEYKRLAAQFAETSKKADDLNNDFKALDHSVGDNSRTVGDYKDQIVNAWDEIGNKFKSGDIKGALASAKDGIGGVKDAIGGLFKFIAANPLVLVLAGIALFVKEMYEYNSKIKELNLEVEQLANTTGKATDELRKNATAIAETTRYNKDFTEAVKEMNSLMIDFGVSSDEAFRIYNEGLAAGGAANSEFGDSIREYGPLFAQSGYSAQEFINILNAGIDLGIYNDKLPDAIKEAGLSLKEQTKSTRDALVNAFGASFTDDILKRIQSGKTSVADALEEISDKAEKAQLNQQQLAQLTADVFKGAGEDAGGALVIFEAINKSQEITYDNLTDLQKATYDVAVANKELSDAKDEAFKSDSMITFQQTLDKVWREIKIAWYKTIGDIVKNTQKEIDFLKSYFYILKDAIVSVPLSFAMVMKGLNGDFRQLAGIAQSVGNVFKNMFNPEALDASIKNLFKKVTDFKSLAVAAVGDVAKLNKGIVSNRTTQVQNERAASNERVRNIDSVTTGSVADAAAKAAKEKAAADAKAKAESDRLAKSNRTSTDKSVRDAEKNAKDKQKILDDATKKAIELAKYEADQTFAIAKNELAEYISLNAAKLDDDKRLTAERLANELKYYDDLKDLQIKNNNAELEKALVDKTEAEKINIRKEYAIKETDITTDINEKKKEINKNYTDQTLEDEKLARSIDFQNRLVELEENNASEYEFNKAQIDEQKRLDAEQLALDLENGLISVENYEAAKNLIERKYAEDAKAISREKERAKRTDAANTLGQVSQLLGQETTVGKAAALAEVTLNGVNAVQNAYTTAQSSPITVFFPGYPIVQAGLAAAFSAKQAAKIAGFDTGGLVGNGFEISRSNGDNRLVTVKTGEVILNENQQALLGGASTFSAIGVPGFAGGGVVARPSDLASVQNSIKVNTGNVSLSNEAVQAIALAVYSGSQNGLGDLAENRKIANGANF